MGSTWFQDISVSLHQDIFILSKKVLFSKKCIKKLKTTNKVANGVRIIHLIQRKNKLMFQTDICSSFNHTFWPFFPEKCITLNVQECEWWLVHEKSVRSALATKIWILCVGSAIWDYLNLVLCLKYRLPHTIDCISFCVEISLKWEAQSSWTVSSCGCAYTPDSV